MTHENLGVTILFVKGLMWQNGLDLEKNFNIELLNK
jgi:hypothetical protein